MVLVDGFYLLFYAAIVLIKFHNVLIKLLEVLTSCLSTLITITWNSLSDKLLASISFSSFSGDSSFSFIWGCFFVSPFLLSLFIVYVLDQTAMPPRLGGWSYVAGVLWDPGMQSL